MLTDTRIVHPGHLQGNATGTPAIWGTTATVLVKCVDQVCSCRYWCFIRHEHTGLNKILHFTENFHKGHFWMNFMVFWIQCHWSLNMASIDNKSLLVHAKTWRWTGTRWFPELIMIWVTDDLYPSPVTSRYHIAHVTMQIYNNCYEIMFTVFLVVGRCLYCTYIYLWDIMNSSKMGQLCICAKYYLKSAIRYVCLCLIW